jgi:hypothetical protein
LERGATTATFFVFFAAAAGTRGIAFWCHGVIL